MMEPMRGLRAPRVDAAIESTERETQLCKTIISLKESDFTHALEHAKYAVLAAEKALRKDPDWVYYQESLASAISLRKLLKHMKTALKAYSAFQGLEVKFNAVVRRNESYLENLVSYKFAREVESYMRREYQYSNTRCNYSPPYLGREIDVYASKGEHKMTITICECKLRLDGQPVNSGEVRKFAEIARTFRRYEQNKAAKEGKQVTVHAWLVTNTDSVRDDAAKVAKTNKISIKQAVIPKSKKRLVSDVNWVISDMSQLA